jgi:small multidrug resistance pump
MHWLYLASAVLLEVCGTLSLRQAATGRPAWYAGVIGCYSLSFALLSMALATGLGVGVAYGIWAASGVALIAVAARVIFKEPLTPLMAAGIGLIMAGVLLVELGRGH